MSTAPPYPARITSTPAAAHAFWEALAIAARSAINDLRDALADLVRRKAVGRAK